METVNFQCGHCGNLIAVSTQHLGQQVRCPHCQQVVLAPLPSPPAPAPPTFDPPDDPDSIFSPPAPSDDLFGGGPQPAVEMPPEVVVTPPAVPNLELTDSPAEFPQPTQETVACDPEKALGFSSATSLATAPEPAPAEWPSPAAAPAEDLGAAIGPVPVRRARGGGWHIALFIIPLISYSILATIAGFMLWWRLQKAEYRAHPLEQLPDVEGDNPTRRKKNTELNVPRPSTDLKLPDHLRTRLGGTVTVGDVEVTALRVERGAIALAEAPGRKPQPIDGEALKLVLRLRNLSADLPFYPLDRYFTRYWRAGTRRVELGKQQNPFRCVSTSWEPYTQLVVGGEHFYGGPAGWYEARSPNDRNCSNEHVAGQELDRELKPGEAFETFLCTDPTDPDLAAALKKHAGKALEWRVQVRRGAVDVKGRRVPASCVVGVEFSDKDVAGPGGG